MTGAPVYGEYSFQSALASCSPPLEPEEELDLAYFHHQRKSVVRAAVTTALLSLDVRERYIIEKRLMAAPGDELTLAQPATGLGISCERTRQLEGRAKLKLKSSTAIRRNRQLSDWFA